MTSAPGSGPRRPNPVVQVGWKMSAAFAGLLALFLLVGVALPGRWAAEAAWTVEAPPEAVFPLLEEPRRWDEWAPWPDMAFTHEGPARGVGASRSWDDAQAGSGTFTITRSEPPSLVGYRVDVEGGRTVTLGTFRLIHDGARTRVIWQEEGDFGGNPLLAWAALSMSRRHGDELERRLQDLAARVEGRAPPS